MGWDESVVPDPQDPDTFSRSKLDWDEARTGDHARLLRLYRDLARLRRERPELTDPAWSARGAVVGDTEEGRTYELRSGGLVVFANLTGQDAAVTVPDGSRVLLSTAELRALPEQVAGATEYVVPAESAVVYGAEL